MTALALLFLAVATICFFVGFAMRIIEAPPHLQAVVAASMPNAKEPFKIASAIMLFLGALFLLAAFAVQASAP